MDMIKHTTKKWKKSGKTAISYKTGKSTLFQDFPTFLWAHIIARYYRDAPKPSQRCWSRGAGGATAPHPQFLENQLTLFKPRGEDYAHKIITAPPPRFLYGAASLHLPAVELRCASLLLGNREQWSTSNQGRRNMGGHLSRSPDYGKSVKPISIMG